MSKIDEYFNSEEYKNNSIEIDVKVTSEELDNAINKLNELNDLIPKVSIDRIENIYITINHFNKEP